MITAGSDTFFDFDIKHYIRGKLTIEDKPALDNTDITAVNNNIL